MDAGRPRPLSIIVAGEDDELRARLSAMVQGGMGARVREALDGWQVMSILLAVGEPIDLVISELRLLRSRVLDALLSARAAGIAVPFLLVTVDRALSIEEDAARLGALILREPVLASELLAGVRRLCGHGGPPGASGCSAA